MSWYCAGLLLLENVLKYEKYAVKRKGLNEDIKY